MSLTENGHGVAGYLRGVTNEHPEPPPGLDRAPGPPAEHVDGFAPRNSARPDLYPHAPQEQGASDHRALAPSGSAGRLDEVTAPGAAEKAAAAEVPAMQLAAPR